MLERNKRTVYLCRRDRTASKTIEIYDTPVPIRFSSDPAQSQYLIAKSGQLDKDILVGTVPLKQVIEKGDRLYINTTPSLIHDPSCNNADYRVVGIMRYHDYLLLTLEGLL